MAAPTDIKWSELVHFNDKQKEAEKAVKNYKYTLYGGAMGGGKSYWLRWMMIKLLMNYYAVTGMRGIRVGLFCEDYPSLDDRHLSKIMYELPPWLGRLNRGNHEYILAPQYGSGVVAFRNLDDAAKYASSEFAAIGVDELTKNLKPVFDMLRTRMRWPGITDVKFLAGTNPGSVGHGWVKEMWMDRKFDPNEREAHLFHYIKAVAGDNAKNLDSNYFLQLQGLPEEKRKAFLEGDWNLFEGQFFSEWKDSVHVCEPFEVPDGWARYGAYDHGRAKPATFGWYAVDYDGRVWKYRELYVNKEDGTSRWEADMIAREVVNITQQAGEKLIYTIADSAIFTKTGVGESIAEVMIRNGMGSTDAIPILLPCQKGEGSRVAGWNIMHQYLYHDQYTPPKMKYFKNCYDSIRTIPSLVYDEYKPEDLDTDGEDHAADIDRYILQSFRARKTKPPKPREQIKIEQFQRKMGVVKSDAINLQRFANL